MGAKERIDSERRQCILGASTEISPLLLVLRPWIRSRPNDGMACVEGGASRSVVPVGMPRIPAPGVHTRRRTLKAVLQVDFHQ